MDVVSHVPIAAYATRKYSSLGATDQSRPAIWCSPCQRARPCAALAARQAKQIEVAVALIIRTRQQRTCEGDAIEYFSNEAEHNENTGVNE